MKEELIIEIAEDRMMSELCLKWYLEEDEEKKKQIYDEEIMPLYKKINKLI
jgi:hypothetical protein